MDLMEICDYITVTCDYSKKLKKKQLGFPLPHSLLMLNPPLEGVCLAYLSKTAEKNLKSLKPDATPC